MTRFLTSAFPLLLSFCPPASLSNSNRNPPKLIGRAADSPNDDDAVEVRARIAMLWKRLSRCVLVKTVDGSGALGIFGRGKAAHGGTSVGSPGDVATVRADTVSLVVPTMGPHRLWRRVTSTGAVRSSHSLRPLEKAKEALLRIGQDAADLLARDDVHGGQRMLREIDNNSPDAEEYDGSELGAEGEGNAVVVVPLLDRFVEATEHVAIGDASSGCVVAPAGMGGGLIVDRLAAVVRLCMHGEAGGVVAAAEAALKELQCAMPAIQGGGREGSAAGWGGRGGYCPALVWSVMETVRRQRMLCRNLCLSLSLLRHIPASRDPALKAVWMTLLPRAVGVLKQSSALLWWCEQIVDADAAWETQSHAVGDASQIERITGRQYLDAWMTLHWVEIHQSATERKSTFLAEGVGGGAVEATMAEITERVLEMLWATRGSNGGTGNGGSGGGRGCPSCKAEVNRFSIDGCDLDQTPLVFMKHFGQWESIRRCVR